MTKINSVMSVLFIIAGYYAVILNKTLNIETGIYKYIGVIVVLILVIQAVIEKKVKLSKDFFLHLSLIGIALLTTFLKYPNQTSLNLFELIYYVLLSYYIGTKEVDTYRVLLYTSLMYSFTIFSFGLIKPEITLSLSYAFFPGIAASILLAVFYFKKNPILITLTSLINFFMAVFFVTKGNRGFFVSVVILVTVLIINRNTMKINNEKNIFGLIYGVLFMFILLFIFTVYLQQIIEMIINMFNALGINIYFLNKTLFYLQQDNLSNGRFDLQMLAIKEFLGAPILGRGIQTFLYNETLNTSYYPHNYIIQLLRDTGVIVGGYYILTSLKAMYTLFFKSAKEKNIYILLIFYFSISIPRVLLSSDIWEVSTFWLFIAVFRLYQKSTKELKKNRI